MKKVLVINLGWEQQPLIEKLAALGVKLFGVHYNENIELSEMFEEIHVSDLRDLDNIFKFANKIKPEAVISDQCDYSHFAQSMIAEHFSLPGPRVTDAQISSNKYLQRSRAKQKGILIPKFALITSIRDLHDFSEIQGFPFILKPIDNRGSFGVSKVEKKESIFSAYEKALVNSHSRLVIAEQFIEGVEITVDGYIFRGEPVSLTLAKKGHVNDTTQVSVDIKYPGEFNREVYEKVLRNNEFVISNLGYTFGMTHAEYMLDRNDNVYLIEAANRGGGVFTSEIIVPNVSGVDVLSDYISDCLHGPTSKKPQLITQRPTILKFFSFKPGKIKSINGFDELKFNADILKYRLAVKEGDVINPITTDANRHGFVIVSSNGNVRKTADEIIERITITYEN
jgi:biotin carboxylase